MNHQMKRKFKIFLSVGLAGSLMAAALVVWGGIAAFKTVSSIGTNPVVQEKIKNWNNSKVPEQVLSRETASRSLPALIKVDCWTAAKNLMSRDVWVEKPLIEHYSDLKSACLNE